MECVWAPALNAAIAGRGNDLYKSTQVVARDEEARRVRAELCSADT